MRVPLTLTDRHHLLFTFYHISCKPSKGGDSKETQTPIGYSVSSIDRAFVLSRFFQWLPLTENGQRLCRSGTYELPIALEKLPDSYFYLSPEVRVLQGAPFYTCHFTRQVNLPNVKWLDNHRSAYSLRIDFITTLHTQDVHLDHFFDVYFNTRAGLKPVDEADFAQTIR